MLKHHTQESNYVIEEMPLTHYNCVALSDVSAGWMQDISRFQEKNGENKMYTTTNLHIHIKTFNDNTSTASQSEFCSYDAYFPISKIYTSSGI